MYAKNIICFTILLILQFFLLVEYKTIPILIDTLDFIKIIEFIFYCILYLINCNIRFKLKMHSRISLKTKVATGRL